MGQVDARSGHSATVVPAGFEFVNYSINVAPRNFAARDNSRQVKIAAMDPSMSHIDRQG